MVIANYLARQCNARGLVLDTGMPIDDLPYSGIRRRRSAAAAQEHHAGCRRMGARIGRSDHVLRGGVTADGADLWSLRPTRRSYAGLRSCGCVQEPQAVLSPLRLSLWLLYHEAGPVPLEAGAAVAHPQPRASTTRGSLGVA